MIDAGLDIKVCPIPVKTEVGQVAMETDIFKHIKIITYEVFVLSKLQSNTFLLLKITSKR
jgi:hypothetical protein